MLRHTFSTRGQKIFQYLSFFFVTITLILLLLSSCFLENFSMSVSIILFTPRLDPAIKCQSKKGHHNCQPVRIIKIGSIYGNILTLVFLYYFWSLSTSENKWKNCFIWFFNLIYLQDKHDYPVQVHDGVAHFDETLTALII